MTVCFIDTLPAFVAARIWPVLSIGYSYAAIGLTSLLSSCGTIGRLEVFVAFFHALIRYISMKKEKADYDMRSNSMSGWKLVILPSPQTSSTSRSRRISRSLS